MSLKKSQREVLFKKYDGLCAYCGKTLGVRWHADHIEPVIRQSTFVHGQGFKPTGKMDYPERDAIENYHPSCAPCNLYKGVLSLEEWRAAIQHLNAVLLRDSSPFRHAIRFGLVAETHKSVIFYFEQTLAS